MYYLSKEDVIQAIGMTLGFFGALMIIVCVVLSFVDREISFDRWIGMLIGVIAILICFFMCTTPERD